MPTFAFIDRVQQPTLNRAAPLSVLQNSTQATAHRLGVIGVLLDHLGRAAAKLDHMRTVHLTRTIRNQERSAANLNLLFKVTCVRQRKLVVAGPVPAIVPEPDPDEQNDGPQFQDDFSRGNLVQKENIEIRNSMFDHVGYSPNFHFARCGNAVFLPADKLRAAYNK